MPRRILALILATATAFPAHAFFAKNGLRVDESGKGTFNVPYRGLSGASDFWCAAGDYVIRDLNMPVTTRIYRLSSPPRRAGQGVQFSLSPKGAKRTGLIRWGEGRGITASHARHLCDLDQLIED